MIFTPSPEQSTIFLHLATFGASNLIVEAVAGSGKTTTIVEALKTIPLARTGLLPPTITFLAFNKQIAETLALRCPKGVQCSTFHALGFRALKRILPCGSKVDGRKVSKYVYNRLDRDDPDIRDIIKLVSLLKSAHPIVDPMTLISHYDLSLEDVPRACRVALEALTKSDADLNVIDFDDMLHLPILHDLEFTPSDWIFIDEAQDTNDIQLEILERISKPTSRLVAVGDPNQAIYGFRGANSDAMTRIASRFSCSSLPLSVSYRCPKAVVAEARKVLL